MRWKNARARFDHSVNQKEYLFWKYTEFNDLATKIPRLITQKPHWQTNKIYNRWHFSTKAIPEMNYYCEVFYRDKRKIIPTNIQELFFEPISLAVWIMDDGYKRNDCDAVRISTDAFSIEEQKRLIDCLNGNFDLHAVLHKKGKWWNIYIPQREIIKLRNIIAPYVIPSMRYKICPVTTDFISLYEKDSLEYSRL